MRIFQKNRRAFTLIELMIVIAIIGILAAIAVPNFNRARERAFEKRCLEQTALLSRTCEYYNIEHKGEYPAAITDLSPYLSGNVSLNCPQKKLPFIPTTQPGGIDRVGCPLHGFASSTYGG
ncbi:prepilin-type N-terminal cleavage/methylation domain-containing protein [bacterium]|nr:prepilin-type N-terminal cleavage/methylation domain-containing protein [bacterium]